MIAWIFCPAETSRSISAITVGVRPETDADADEAGAVRAVVGDGVNTCGSGSFGRMPRSATARIATTTIRPTTIAMIHSTASMGSV